jgi:F0F1-type ATP synthase delta subunit
MSDVERIAAQPDPVLRNLAITHCYHQLAIALTERTGLEANWCAFATWASKQAGQTIRKEDLARTLRAYLGNEQRVKEAEQFVMLLRKMGVRVSGRNLVELMWRATNPESIFAHSSDAVARGNLKVFAEIGYEFARFYAACLSDITYDQQNIDRFASALRPGPPPDGQDYLRQAFQNYYQALFEPQVKARSELLLLANLLVGFHEQTRLQPEIVEALEAPVLSPKTFIQNLVNAYYANASWLANGVLSVLRRAGRLVGFDAFVEDYLSVARRQAQRMVTGLMMTIELPPHLLLHLGKDLRSAFPPDLLQIANPDLIALLHQIDPTPDDLKDSGAYDWGDLPDRIHFIADMFRCYQASADLFSAPFSAQQIAALQAGRLPSGPL